MSQSAADEPNALDALSGADQRFAIVDPDDPSRIGYLRPQLWGDLRAYSHATGYLDKVVTLVDRCGDDIAKELMDKMEIDEGFATYNRWEAALVARINPGK